MHRTFRRLHSAQLLVPIRIRFTGRSLHSSDMLPAVLGVFIITTLTKDHHNVQGMNRKLLLWSIFFVKKFVSPFFQYLHTLESKKMRKEFFGLWNIILEGF